MKFYKLFILIHLIIPIHFLFGLDEWMYIYHPTLNDIYIQQNIYKYQLICITGYKIDQYGNLITNLKISNYNSLLKNKTVYPLISLTNSKEGKLFISNDTYRKKAINNIINLAQDPIFEGVHIDFEYLTENESIYFAEFLKDLKQHIRKINKKLTIAIFPPIWQLNYNKFHNLELISPYPDEIVLMTYDQYNPQTKPGPVAELNWIEENLKYTLKHIQKDKIYLGTPLYGYEWDVNTNRYRIVDNNYYKKIINSNYNKKVMKSTTYGTKIEYYDNKNTNKILFYPDEEFRNQIKQLAKKYNIKGIAYWRLGYEK